MSNAIFAEKPLTLRIFISHKCGAKINFEIIRDTYKSRALDSEWL